MSVRSDDNRDGSVDGKIDGKPSRPDHEQAQGNEHGDTTAELKGIRARHAEAQAELAELQLHYARQGTLLRDLGAAAAAERAAAAEETNILKTELDETRKREVTAVAAAAASAKAALNATSALQQRHDVEKQHASVHERQLSALGAQLQMQRNATATAAGSTIELQAKLKRVQDKHTEAIAAANMRVDKAEKRLRAAEAQGARFERDLEDMSAEISAANKRADEAESHSRPTDLRRVAAEQSFLEATARADVADAHSRTAEARQTAAETALKDLQHSSNVLLVAANARADAAEALQKLTAEDHKRELESVARTRRRIKRRRAASPQHGSVSASSSSSSDTHQRKKSPDVTKNS